VTGHRIGVLQLSESFADLWAEWATELGATVIELSVEELPPPDVALCIVSGAGEEERAAEHVAALHAVTKNPIFVVGAETSHRFAVEYLRRGATDYFVLPADVDLCRRSIGRVVEQTRVVAEAAQAEDAFGTLIGASPAFTTVIDATRRVAKHGDVTVLIQGETGTGKELVARALHEHSPRHPHPFIAVNCAAIPRELMESELFGHERGAFTDAHAAKPGLFEEAHTGTLFLDEIGNMPLPLQGKLLRALEERRIRRLGSVTSIDVDVRFIAATHVDLQRAVGAGEFREDLYYRLNVVPITLPPLRERGEDTILLARHFATVLAERYALPVPSFGPEAVTTLRSNVWPGNVRELRHAIERALLLSTEGTLDAAHFVMTPRTAAPTSGVLPFPATLDQITTAAAQAMVTKLDGNKSGAARMLGVSRSRLQRLLDRESDQ
jgi:two-component system response regulator HydG